MPEVERRVRNRRDKDDVAELVIRIHDENKKLNEDVAAAKQEIVESRWEAKRGRRRSWIAYLLVIAMSAGGLAWVATIADEPGKVSQEACADVNGLRATLRGILDRSEKNVKGLAEQGVLPESVVAQQLEQVQESKRELASNPACVRIAAGKQPRTGG